MSKIDSKLDDVLKHHGIKGMKWDVHRSPEQIMEDVKNGVNAAGDTIDDVRAARSGQNMIGKEISDILSDIFNGKGDMHKDVKDLKRAVSDVSNDIKKKGSRLLTKLFGKATNRMS